MKERTMTEGERLTGPATGWTRETAFIAASILDDLLADIEGPVENAELNHAIRELVDKRNLYLLLKRGGDTPDRFDGYRRRDDWRQVSLLDERYVPKVDRKKLEP